MNYYNRHYYRPKKRVNSIVEEDKKILNEVKYLKKLFGEDYHKPIPEDYELNTELMKIVDIHNYDANKFNKKYENKRRVLTTILTIATYCFIYIIFNYFNELFKISDSVTFLLVIGIFYSLFGIPQFIYFLTSKLFLNYKNHHPLSSNLDHYNDKLSAYPSDAELKLLLNKYNQIKVKIKTKEFWFSLNGHEFEDAVATLLRKYNYTDVIKTKGSGDGGVDIILRQSDGKVTYVECKAHKKPVGPHVVRGLYGAMKSAGIENGVIVSLMGITEAAEDFINGKNIRVIP